MTIISLSLALPPSILLSLSPSLTHCKAKGRCPLSVRRWLLRRLADTMQKLRNTEQHAEKSTTIPANNCYSTQNNNSSSSSSNCNNKNCNCKYKNCNYKQPSKCEGNGHVGHDFSRRGFNYRLKASDSAG